MRPLSLLLFLCLLSQTLFAKVDHIEIDSRDTLLDGKIFGTTGPYELIQGRIYFAFDPANPYNQQITDIELAKRNATGWVEAWSELIVLQPLSPENRKLALVEVSNRGGKFSLRYFNRATQSGLDPSAPSIWGDGLMMEQGLTVIWIGWQFDVPDGGLKLRVPKAVFPEGSPIQGWVRSDWVVDEATKQLGLGHRNLEAYPVSDTNNSHLQLTRRSGRLAPREIIDRQAFQFLRETETGRQPSLSDIYCAQGFAPGYIYEMVYPAIDPPVVGLGQLAIRDVISYAKYDPDCPFPVEKGIAAGVSQTGRFLRQFLYDSSNRDEQGRKAYEGMMIITAGAGRGSFNHRFAQPSRDGHRYSAFFYPTDLFPFTSRVQSDSVSGQKDGLLSRVEAAFQPKIFAINTGYEYWGRAAALIHVSVDGKRDIEPLPNERIYHLASGQHFVNPIPPVSPSTGQTAPAFYYGDPLDYSANYRALLVQLVDWVATDQTPVPSQYPHLTDGSLVPLDQVNWPEIPGLKKATVAQEAYRADYGPRWPSERIIDQQPPILGPAYPVLLPQVDGLGNEQGGIRNLELRVPLATYLPWHLREGRAGGKGELDDFRGTWIPFPATIAQQQAWADPRPPIALFYANRQAYEARIDQAIQALIKEGFVLERDQEYLRERAARYWEALE